MSDRAPLTVELLAFPEEHRSDIAALFAEHYLEDEEGGLIELGSEPDMIAGHSYMEEEVALGYDHDIAVKLQEWGCTAVVTQDAKYEYNAMAYYVHPELGLWGAEGNQDGAVVITADGLDKVIESNEPEDLVRALHVLTGKPWRDAIERVRGALSSDA